MIEAAKIDNFRLFEAVELSGLSQINIVVGDNSGGKTSLLEALFAGTATTIEVGSRFRLWRGLEFGSASAQEFYDGVFLNLFYGFDRSRTVTISLRGSEPDTRTLRFYYDPAAPASISVPIDEPVGDSKSLAQAYVPVSFEWSDATGSTAKSTMQVSGNNLIVVGVASRANDPTFLPARIQFNPTENAKWLSDLRKSGKDSDFVKAMQLQFPDIEEISNESDLGGYTIHVKQKWSSQLVPVALISDGMNKLMTILLHIAHSAGTASFFDEVENGLHFSRHKRLWRQMYDFGKAFKTQVFASTHSLECLRAALPVIKQHPKDFTLIRTFKREGKGAAAVIGGAEALHVIASGLEVRE